jgi:hypothetical protein
MLANLPMMLPWEPCGKIATQCQKMSRGGCLPAALRLADRRYLRRSRDRRCSSAWRVGHRKVWTIKTFAGVAQTQHIRALLRLKMGLRTATLRRHHETANAKGSGLCKILSFGRGMGSLVCLVSGHHCDEQIFGTLGVARIC